MAIWRRIINRAGVLSAEWLHRNAFVVGLLFGGSVTTLIILIH